MNKRIEAYKAFNDPLNDKQEQYSIIRELMVAGVITVQDALDIIWGLDLVQEQFNQDLEDILKEDND